MRLSHPYHDHIIVVNCERDRQGMVEKLDLISRNDVLGIQE